MWRMPISLSLQLIQPWVCVWAAATFTSDHVRGCVIEGGSLCCSNKWSPGLMTSHNNVCFYSTLMHVSCHHCCVLGSSTTDTHIHNHCSTNKEIEWLTHKLLKLPPNSDANNFCHISLAKTVMCPHLTSKEVRKWNLTVVPEEGVMQYLWTVLNHCHGVGLRVCFLKIGDTWLVPGSSPEQKQPWWQGGGGCTEGLVIPCGRTRGKDVEHGGSNI